MKTNLSLNFKEKVTLVAEETNVIESKDESGNKAIYLEGVAITFGVPTRNRVSYTYQSGMQTYRQLISRPFLDSHQDSSIRTHPPYGHVENVWMGTNPKNNMPCLFYRVNVDPMEETFIRKIKRKDCSGVSIQVLVGEVNQKEDKAGEYIEANIQDWLELSAVLIPGDPTTSSVIAERFHEQMKSLKEEIPSAQVPLCPNCNKPCHPIPDGGFGCDCGYMHDEKFNSKKIGKEPTIGMGKESEGEEQDIKMNTKKKMYRDKDFYPKEEEESVKKEFEGERGFHDDDDEEEDSDDKDKESKEEATAIKDTKPSVDDGEDSYDFTFKGKKIKYSTKPRVPKLVSVSKNEKYTECAAPGLRCPKCSAQLLKDNFDLEKLNYHSFQLRCTKCGYIALKNERLFKEYVNKAINRNNEAINKVKNAVSAVKQFRSAMEICSPAHLKHLYNLYESVVRKNIVGEIYNHKVGKQELKTESIDEVQAWIAFKEARVYLYPETVQ